MLENVAIVKLAGALMQRLVQQEHHYLFKMTHFIIQPSWCYNELKRELSYIDLLQ